MGLALYRKHRPGTFADVVGQEHVTEPLQRALANGRIGHAYLFSGPRGCGKTSSARILARSLNCVQGPTPQPCGACESCVALRPDGPGSLDVIEIDAASHNGVDDARDLRERAFFAPVSSRYKVYIIDEAHMISSQGFNALLKLVEEPPEFVVFVFATTEPERVLPTIRSRTQHYPFRLVPPSALREHLARVCEVEGVAVEDAALPLVVRAGAGSVRDALSVLDQLIAGSGPDGVTLAGALGLLGYTDATLLDEVVDAIGARDAAGLFEVVDRAVESGLDPRRFTADLLERVRDLVVLDAVPGAAEKGLLQGCSADQVARMTAQAAAMGPAELSRTADLLHAGLVEMRGTTSPRLLLELVCARVLLPAAASDASSVLARLDRLELRLSVAGPGEGQAGGQAPTGAPQRPGRAPDRQDGPAPSTPRGGPERAAGGAAPPTAGEPVRAGAPAAAAARPTPSASWPDAAGPGSGAGSSPGTTDGSRGAAGEGRPATAGAGAPRDAAPAGRHGAAAPRPAARPVPPPAQGPPDPAPAAPAPGATGPGDPGPGPGGAASTSGLDAAAVRQVWPEVLEAVRRRTRAAWTMLSSGVSVAAVQGGELRLAFENANLIGGFVQAGRDIVLREALLEVLGAEFRVVPEPAGRGPSGPAPSARPPRPGPARASARDEEPPADDDEPPDDAGDPGPDAGAPGAVVSGEDAALALVRSGLGGRVIGGTDAG